MKRAGGGRKNGQPSAWLRRFGPGRLARLHRVLAWFGVALALGSALAPAAAAASSGLEAECAVLDARVARVRGMLASVDAEGTEAPQPTAVPGTNWQNWGNWNNWPNWGNWGNWFNR